MDTTATRIGGLFGFAAALIIIPAYVVGTPDAPNSANQAERYYEANSTFVTANGVLPLFHVLFFIVFLGALIVLLRRAENGRSGFAITALAGGIAFVTLEAAGFAAEVAYPAALVRYEELPLGGAMAPLLLTLSTWLYHYAQVGATALIIATSAVIWRTELLPKWVAVGGVIGVVTLLHTWMPLTAAICGLVWIGAMGLVLLLVPPKLADPAGA